MCQSKISGKLIIAPIPRLLPLKVRFAGLLSTALFCSSLTFTNVWLLPFKELLKRTNAFVREIWSSWHMKLQNGILNFIHSAVINFQLLQCYSKETPHKLLYKINIRGEEEKMHAWSLNSTTEQSGSALRQVPCNPELEGRCMKEMHE